MYTRNRVERFLDRLFLLMCLVLLTVALCRQAKADEPDTAAKTPVTEWVFDAVLAADMLTTADIQHHPKLCETNPILGQHPSDAKIAAYGLSVATLHWLLTRELVREHVPAPIVQSYEALSIGIEVGYVAHNYSIGLRARF